MQTSPRIEVECFHTMSCELKNHYHALGKKLGFQPFQHEPNWLLKQCIAFRLMTKSGEHIWELGGCKWTPVKTPHKHDGNLAEIIMYVALFLTNSNLKWPLFIFLSNWLRRKIYIWGKQVEPQRDTKWRPGNCWNPAVGCTAGALARCEIDLH